MARRLTTTSQADQEIAGSIPAEIIFFLKFFVLPGVCGSGGFFFWSRDFYTKQSVFWPNGKALDYDFSSRSRDCRFDPCGDHSFLFFLCTVLW
jgi:hypothetical protein